MTRLVETWVIVALVERDGISAEQAKQWLYDLAYRGTLTNHGGPLPGQALWDLQEARAHMRFDIPHCPGTNI